MGDKEYLFEYRFAGADWGVTIFAAKMTTEEIDALIAAARKGDKHAEGWLREYARHLKFEEVPPSLMDYAMELFCREDDE